MLCRMNIIQSDLHVARSEHIPVAGRMSKEKKKTEEKRASLHRTSVTCRRITEMALASAANDTNRVCSKGHSRVIQGPFKGAFKGH